MRLIQAFKNFHNFLRNICPDSAWQSIHFSAPNLRVLLRLVYSFWLCSSCVVYLIIHRIIPSPPWFDCKAHTQAYSQVSLLPAPTAREQKKKKGPRKWNWQILTIKRSYSCQWQKGGFPVSKISHTSPTPLGYWAHGSTDPENNGKQGYQKGFSPAVAKTLVQEIPKPRAINMTTNKYFVQIFQTLSASWGDLGICNFSVDLGNCNLGWVTWLGDS